MAVRTIACLPAITGHWRRAGGGVQLSTSANFQFNRAALERPDLSPPVRTINMIRLGEALTTPDAGVGGPPVRALVVYNSQPRRGRARSQRRACADWRARTCSPSCSSTSRPTPPTGRTSCSRRRRSSSTGTCTTRTAITTSRSTGPSIEPLGECKPNSEIFRLLAARMGIDHAAMRDDDLTLIRQALDTPSDKLKGVTLEALLEHGWTRLNVPRPYLPFAEGKFPTPSGKCEFYSQRLADMGLDPLPTFTPPYESPDSAPELAARYPLSLISSPAHQFLNSTFVNVDVAAPRRARARAAAPSRRRGAPRHRRRRARGGAQRSR